MICGSVAKYSFNSCRLQSGTQSILVCSRHRTSSCIHSLDPASEPDINLTSAGKTLSQSAHFTDNLDIRISLHMMQAAMCLQIMNTEVTAVHRREVLKGFETLTAMEGMETTKEGIFVMPKERISILSSYVYSSLETDANCEERLAALQERFDAQAHHMHQMRLAKLP